MPSITRSLHSCEYKYSGNTAVARITVNPVLHTTVSVGKEAYIAGVMWTYARNDGRTRENKISWGCTRRRARFGKSVTCTSLRFINDPR